MSRLIFIPLLVFPCLAWSHALAGHAHLNSWAQIAANNWVGLPLAMVLGLYLIGVVRMQKKSGRLTAASCYRLWMFLGGWSTLVMALLTPVDTLGNRYFSMHMVQHELLMIVAAPLLVLARPLAMWAWAFPQRWVGGITHVMQGRLFSEFWKMLTHPLSAWTIHAGVLWCWHIPFLFENALHKNWLHDLQHLNFFVSALLFWWSLMQIRSSRSPTIMGLVSLFTTALHTALLGALLTLSNQVWYPLYITTTGGLEQALQDQQLGGLIMWVPGGLTYLILALWLCYKVLDNPQTTTNRAGPITDLG